MLNPFGLLDAFRTVFPSYQGYQQQDSQEFVSLLLDYLHEESKVKTGETACTPWEQFALDNKSALA